MAFHVHACVRLRRSLYFFKSQKVSLYSLYAVRGSLWSQTPGMSHVTCARRRAPTGAHMTPYLRPSFRPGVKAYRTGLVLWCVSRRVRGASVSNVFLGRALVTEVILAGSSFLPSPSGTSRGCGVADNTPPLRCPAPAAQQPSGMLEGVLLLGGLPFPPVPRALPAQVAAMEALRQAAPAFSANATPALLERLDSVAFREALLACCSASGWATRPAAALLDELRENVYSSELVHTFDGSRYPDMSIEIGLHNESGYFPSLWQLLFLGYYVRARALRPDSTTSGLPVTHPNPNPNARGL